MDITINSGDSGYIDFYAYGFDETEFKRGYDQLKADSLQVERFTDTEISGTVNAAENGVLYTSIPYDEGWTVTVDGEKVAKQDLLAVGDALLAIPIGSGSHTVSFHTRRAACISALVFPYLRSQFSFCCWFGTGAEKGRFSWSPIPSGRLILIRNRSR